MTLKEAIKEVVSNRPSLYPNGWDTEIGKILQNTVQDFCISLRVPYSQRASRALYQGSGKRARGINPHGVKSEEK